MSKTQRHQAFTGLKNLLCEPKQQFSIVQTYFFDHLVDTGLLEKYNRPIKKDQEPFFKALLEPILKYFNTPVTVTQILLLEVADEGFTHGMAFLSNGRMLNLFYFSDVQVGLANFLSERGTMEFFRISAFTGNRAADSNSIVVPTMGKAKH